jgi:hypothetical protein
VPPDAPSVIHDTALLAVHWQFDPVLTAMPPDPPELATFAVVGESEYVHAPSNSNWFDTVLGITPVGPKAATLES